jgi:RNA recognition motif-containing protein
MSVRLYVGNLPKEPIERQKLQDLFADAGKLVTTKVIKDRKTGKCRGFAFVTVPNDEAADQFIEKYNGQSFMENPLKIEKALPRSKGKSEEGEQVAVVAKPSSPTPAPTPSGASRKSKRNRRNNNSSNSATISSSSSDSFQPDPRWAADLAKLKEMLLAQTANS